MVTKPKSSNLNKDFLLMKLVDELKLVNQKLDSLIELSGKMLKTWVGIPPLVSDKSSSGTKFKRFPDPLSLLSLPLSLRKTAMVFYKIDKATAEDLARETKRLRSVESGYANQLVRMGYLSKKREGRNAYFYIESQMEIAK